jgi:tetratricopeptide (TPR) repeat protein
VTGRCLGVALGLALRLAAPDVARAQDPGGLPVALEPIVLRIWEEGQQAEARSDWEGAAVRYQAVRRQDPTFVPALLALARVELARGQVEVARAALSEGATPEVLVALGRLEIGQGAPDAAVPPLLRAQAAAPSGEILLLLAEARAAIDPDAAVATLDAWRTWVRAGPPEPTAPEDDVVRVLLAVIDALVVVDRIEDAVAVADTHAPPDSAVAARVADRVDSLRLDVEARALMRAAPQALDPSARADLGAIEAAIAAGRLDEAASDLDALVAVAPRSPEVWGVVADLALATGDVARADDALVRADRLSPLDARYAARLGDLLAERYAGREDSEASDAYARALRQDPRWAEVWARKAAVDLRRGEIGEAREALTRVLALPSLDLHPAARVALADLDRERPPPPELPPGPGRPAEVPVDAWEALHRARVLQGRGDVDAALIEVERALTAAPRFPRALNVKAALLIEVGEEREAIAAYEASLAVDPDQSLLYPLLAALYEDHGDAAAAAAVLARAVEHGVGDAHYVLARIAADEGRLAVARQHLDAFDRVPHTERYEADAARLRDALDARRRQVTLGALVVFTIGLAALAQVVWRARRRVDVAGLVARADAVAPEVARLAGAVRHEVLKHDTTVLAAVAARLEAGDRSAGKWAASRLFGPNGTARRLDDQLADLRALARGQGLRLDLPRDPVFGPLIATMRRLRRLRRPLEAGDPKIASDLREVADILQGRLFAAVGQLVRSLSVFPVDRGALSDAVARAVPTGPRPEVVGEGGALVRLPRSDLEDLVVNLVRNATAASPEPGSVRVALAIDVDPVTFHEAVVIRVADRATAALRTDDFRDRPPDRGLGLVARLVERAGGSVTVEPEAGFYKAVVVRLPAVEQAEPGLEGA